MSQQNYTKLEKKIVYLLAKLPSEHLLKLSKTQKQRSFWLAGRRFHEWASQCLQARFTGEDDPLMPLLCSGQLSQITYQRIWLMVDFYEHLWGLVQLGLPHVQSELEGSGLEFLAKSAYKLFIRLAWNEANSSFAVCLKPYHEVSARKYEQAYRLAAKGCQEGLNPLEERKLHGILNQHQPDLLLKFVLAVCHQKANRRRLALKSKLEMFYIALGKLCEKEATTSRKAGSHAWKNGEMGEGDKDGTYKFS